MGGASTGPVSCAVSERFAASCDNHCGNHNCFDTYHQSHTKLSLYTHFLIKKCQNTAQSEQIGSVIVQGQKWLA